MTINDDILSKLKEIEETEKVCILYAVESGSRAWGFGSKDSDYDVRFIYVRPIEWYLSIEDKRDVIECPIEDELDVNGWDIRKALQLYKRTNPPLCEWLLSPIIYLEKGTLAQQLRELMPKYYSPKACLYHYLQMAKRNYRDYLQGEAVRVKKYFYVLRPIFACMWIEQHNAMPPTSFIEVFQTLPIQEALRKEINALLLRKQSAEELAVEKRIDVINEFLDKKISYFETFAREMKNVRKNTDVELDTLFQETVQDYTTIK